MVQEQVSLVDLKKEGEVVLDHVEVVVAAVEIEIGKKKEEEEEDLNSVSEVVVVAGSAGGYTQRKKVVRKVEHSLEQHS